MTSSWPDSPTIGQRLVVRHRTGATAPSGRPELTDVIGHVRSIDGSSVLMERRDGALITISRSDVVAWKAVPEAPQRSARRPQGPVEST